jgi:signal peptidase I
VTSQDTAPGTGGASAGSEAPVIDGSRDPDALDRWWIGAPDPPGGAETLADPGGGAPPPPPPPGGVGGGRGHGRSRRRVSRVTEWLAVLVVAGLAAVGLRTYVVQVFYVPSGSMIPTLQVGDRIVVDKFLFSPSSLHDGDIVVFARPPGDTAGVCDDPTATDLVKRVVATPGQTIRSIGNAIYVDGKKQSESYLPPGTTLGRAVRFERIPKGQYFVMGDNRSLSCDSRYWGTVQGSTIVGKVIAVIWRDGHPALHFF